MSFHEFLWQQFIGLPGWAQTFIQAAIIFVAGALVIGILHGWLGKIMERSKRVDQTLRDFFLALFHVGAWALVAVGVLYVFGVSGALLGGILAVGGFVVGFAMKDSLANLAAGSTLLIYRPFNVNDVVEVDGQVGKVETMGLAMTTLRLYDARIASMANSQVLGNTIINWTREPTRMADVEVGIAYDDDIDVAMKAILKALETDERVLADPPPEVRIRALADSSVTLHVRPWVKTADLFKAKADFHQVAKKALEEAGCTIPFPQRDVHFFPAANGGPADREGSKAERDVEARTRR